jgi:hypothetical protein
MADYLALKLRLHNLSMVDFLTNKYDCAKSNKVAKLIVKSKYHLSGIEFFQLTKYMNKKEGFDAAWFLARAGYFFTFEELNSFLDHRVEILCDMAEHGFEFTIDEILKIGEGQRVACAMAKHGHQFTIDEILKIDNYFDPFGFSFSFWLESHFHKFSFDDLIKLGNPVDSFGASLAHWMAFQGYRFSMQELNNIGSLVISYTNNQLYEEDVIFGGGYDMNENETYQQKRYILHNGATVAHIMAREGFQFTEEEIEQLGNPKDNAGLTINDWMQRYEEQKLIHK